MIAVSLRVYVFLVAGGVEAGDSIWRRAWGTSPTIDTENFTAFSASEANW